MKMSVAVPGVHGDGYREPRRVCACARGPCGAGV